MSKLSVNRALSVSGILLSAVLSQSTAPAAADVKPLPAVQSSFKKCFVGTMDKNPIRLNLERDNSSLHGEYHYVPRKVALIYLSNRSLEGKVDSMGEFTLEESMYNEENKEVRTGRLKGIITRTGRDLKLSGARTGSDSDKPLKLELMEVGAGLPRGVEIKSARMREPNRKLADRVDARYPLIAGSSDKKFLRCNRFIRKHVAGTMADFKKQVREYFDKPDILWRVSLHIDYELMFADKDLISVVFLEETDYAGAHPNSYETYVNYSIKNGHEIKLPQIFKRNVDYKALLAKISRDFNDFLTTEIDSYLESGNLSDWYFDDQGIYIHFSIPHAAGSNAALFIPYGVLKDVLDPDGPIGVLAAKAG